MRKVTLLLFGALFSSLALAQTGPSQGVLDTLLAHFVNASVGQMRIAQGFAMGIFLTCASIDMVLFSAKKVLSSGDLSDWIGGVTLKILTYAFFWMFIKMAPEWIPKIIQSFTAMGQAFNGGKPIVTPSGIVGQGFQAATAVWNAWRPSANPLSFGADLIMAVIIVGSMIFTICGFFLVSLQLLIAQVEMTIITGPALLLLGFSGASFTTMFSEKFIGYIFSSGLKLMLIIVIAGLGENLSQGLVTLISDFSSNGGAIPPLTLLTASFTMLMYGVFAMMVPSIAAAAMNGMPSMSAGGIAGGAAAMAGGIAGAGMAAAGAAAGLAGAAGGSGASSALENLTKLTSLGGNVGSSGGENYDYLSSLSNGGGSSGGMDSIGNPSISPEASRSSGSSQPSMLDKGVGLMKQAGEKLASSDSGSGGISIRFNHLGD